MRSRHAQSPGGTGAPQAWRAAQGHSVDPGYGIRGVAAVSPAIARCVALDARHLRQIQQALSHQQRCSMDWGR